MCSCVVASCKRWICILHDLKQAEESKAFISNFIKNSSKGGFNCQFDLVPLGGFSSFLLGLVSKILSSSFSFLTNDTCCMKELSSRLFPNSLCSTKIKTLAFSDPTHLFQYDSEVQTTWREMTLTKNVTAK